MGLACAGNGIPCRRQKRDRCIEFGGSLRLQGCERARREVLPTRIGGTVRMNVVEES